MLNDSSHSHQINLLLVENSRTARAILTQQLEMQGYFVEAVGSGVEAIECIHKNDYAIVIMDVFLPQMNGYEAAKQIRNLKGSKSNVFLVGYTSSTDPQDRQTCLKAGMNAYLLKSEDHHELFSLLAQHKLAIAK